jgi:hypothetical protein
MSSYSHTSTSCSTCSAGRYNQYTAQTSSSSCRSCQSGQTSSSGASSCYTITCASGKYKSGSSWCVSANFLVPHFTVSFCHHQALTNVYPAVTTATRGGTRAVRVTPTVPATTAKREGIKGATAKARAGIVPLGNTSPPLVDPTADRAKRESTSRTMAGAPADHANLDATTQTPRAPAHIRAKVAALGSTSPAVRRLRALPAR